MRILVRTLIAAIAFAVAAPAWSQEVLVSAQRRGGNSGDPGYYNGIVSTSRPVVNLRRTADYAVQTIRVTGDTRDAATRRKELDETIRNTIAAADKAGIELATGDYVLNRLTLANYKNLSFSGDGRPDTGQTSFLAKVRLTPGMDIQAAEDRIAKFVAAVPKSGRTAVAALGSMTLSVINPDQYRGQIIDLIAADAAVSAGKFGTDSGVDVTGLDRPVEWAQAGPTEVFLFLPASYVVRKH